MKKTWFAVMTAISLGLMAESQEPMKLPVSDWRALETRIALEPSDVLKITYPNGTKTKWPEARRGLPKKGIDGYDVLRGEMRLSGKVPSSGVTFILYATGFQDEHGNQVPARRLIANTDQILKQRPVPAEQWFPFEWDYKILRAWATPANAAPFNFMKVDAIGISCYQRKTSMTLELRNLRFEKKSGLSNTDQATFEKFKQEHKSGTLANKKLILWAYTKTGRQSNTVADTLAALPEYRKYSGIDGISMDISHDRGPGEGPGSFRDRIFTEEPWSPAWQKHLDEAVKAVNSADWGHIRNNFFRLDIVGQELFKNADGTSKALDWFDDKLWQIILPKVTKFAEAARRANANITFDNESYTTRPYDYMRYQDTGRSFAEYEKKVRQRGREVAAAFAAGHPQASVILMFGSWVVEYGKEQDLYGLLPAFIDGMCEADTSLQVIDGYERGYEFSDRESVLRGLFDQKTVAPLKSSIPERYRQKMKVGFGIWIQSNGIQPEPFARMTLETLRECDGYVWLYTEGAALDKPKTHAYLSAISRVRENVK